jgi:hypothetical protein
MRTTIRPLDESDRRVDEGTASELILEIELPMTESLLPAFQHWYECEADSVRVAYNGRYFFAWENDHASWNT